MLSTLIHTIVIRKLIYNYLLNRHVPTFTFCFCFIIYFISGKLFKYFIGSLRKRNHKIAFKKSKVKYLTNK